MMQRLPPYFRRFPGCDGGNYAIIAALLLPMLAGVAGGAVDFYVYNDQQRQLQNVADSATLAATREASLGGWSQEKAEAVVDSYIEANLKTFGAGSAVYTRVVTVDEENRRVTVAVDQDHYGYFVAGYFKHSPQIRVTSAAQASGNTNVCVIGLHENGNSTISLDSNSVLSAPNCAVYSNSSATKGMASLSNSVMTAGLACSAGGYEGAARNYNKLPLTDCPIVADPLASRLPPSLTGLPEFENVRLKDKTQSIGPGIYEGGLKIDGNAIITLTPGIYVMKDGPFVVDSNSVVRGVGIGMYFTGEDAHFRFKSNAEVDLEAPSDGDMAGLLFFQDRVPDDDEDDEDEDSIEKFTIESNFTRNLVGTIYLPRGNLVIDADNEVADQSAYTAIVVRKLKMESGPNLVLNTDYDDTTVPVPEGLGGSKGDLRLLQ